MCSNFGAETTALDLDLLLDFVVLTFPENFRDAETDLTLDGAPPDRWEYLDKLSDLIFCATLLC